MADIDLDSPRQTATSLVLTCFMNFAADGKVAISCKLLSGAELASLFVKSADSLMRVSEQILEVVQDHWKEDDIYLYLPGGWELTHSTLPHNDKQLHLVTSTGVALPYDSTRTLLFWLVETGQRLCSTPDVSMLMGICKFMSTAGRNTLLITCTVLSGLEVSLYMRLDDKVESLQYKVSELLSDRCRFGCHGQCDHVQGHLVSSMGAVLPSKSTDTLLAWLLSTGQIPEVHTPECQPVHCDFLSPRTDGTIEIMCKSLLGTKATLVLQLDVTLGNFRRQVHAAIATNCVFGCLGQCRHVHCRLFSSLGVTIPIESTDRTLLSWLVATGQIFDAHDPFVRVVLCRFLNTRNDDLLVLCEWLPGAEARLAVPFDMTIECFQSRVQDFIQAACQSSHHWSCRHGKLCLVSTDGVVPPSDPSCTLLTWVRMTKQSHCKQKDEQEELSAFMSDLLEIDRDLSNRYTDDWRGQILQPYSHRRDYIVLSQVRHTNMQPQLDGEWRRWRRRASSAWKAGALEEAKCLQFCLRASEADCWNFGLVLQAFLEIGCLHKCLDSDDAKTLKEATSQALRELDAQTSLASVEVHPRHSQLLDGAKAILRKALEPPHVD